MHLTHSTMRFKLLFFLFLFAHRIKATDLASDEDFDFDEASSDQSSSAPVSGTNGGCASDQFQCVASGKCIDKYMFCDYIVDCAEDASDETSCGTCNFQNGSTCGWKDVSGVKSGGWQLMSTNNYMSTPPVTQATEFKLLSPNLHGIGYFCQMVMHINVVSKNPKTVLYVYHKISDREQRFGSYNYKDMRDKADWTEISLQIRQPYNGALVNHSNYVVQVGAQLMDAGDRVTIKEIHFDNCNPKRTIGDCDFEDDNLCHWRLNTDRSVIPWVIGRGDQVNATYAPTADHTRGTSSGYYLWTVLSPGVNSTQSVPVAVLTSVPFEFRVCVTFWYYMDGASFLQLTLTDQRINTNQTINDVMLSAPTGAVWRYKQADILYRGAPFLVNIEAQIEDPNAVIAIDDILVKIGGCSEGGPLCDFETDSCGYQISESNISAWQRIQSKAMTKLTSMTFYDHSTGTQNGYMMLFIPKQEGDSSWLVSPETDFSGYRCLQFYYYISDDNVGTLEVSHHTGLDQGNGEGTTDVNGFVRRSQSTLLLDGFWRKVTLTLEPIDESVVEFEATAGSRLNDAFIAIDDIQLTSGRCRPPVSCDFEFDDCGWRMDQEYSMTPFERQKPALKRRNYCLGPAVDHSLKTSNGHYLYFCYRTPDQLMATIKSDDFDASQDWCFSFWTFFTNVTSIRVDLYLITIAGSNQIAAIKGVNSTDWKYQEVNIPSDSQNEIYYLRMVVTPYDFMPNQGVAIDDIKLLPFKCGYRPTPDDPTPGHKRPKEKLLPEFSCNFEVNECNYSVDRSNGTTFNLVKANAPVNRRPNVPVVDHTYHAYDGGYLELQASNTPSKGKYAVLAAKQTISPDQVSSGDTMINTVCVHFWYVMNGEAINWLNVSTMMFSNDSLDTVYHLEGTFGPTWRHKSVPITFYDAFYLYFIGSSSSLSDGVLALDDISVTVGYCPIEALCDFSFDSCGWDNNISLPLRWQITSAFSLNFNAAVNASPAINDHTTQQQYGQYMYLNVSTFDTTGQSGQLISPMTKPNKKCLQFWYYFYGRNVGQLNVYAVYNGLVNLKFLLKSELNSDVNQWMFSQVPLQRHFYDMDFQFVIEVKRGNDFGDTYHVALDDVEIRDFCQPIGSCDFEQDFCAYQNLGDLRPIVQSGANYSMWDRAHGKSFFNNGGLQPKSDHTTRRRNGVYAYLDKGPVATLYTPYFAITGPMCLTFFYYLNVGSGGNLPSIEVTLDQLRDNNTLSHLLVTRVDAKSRASDPRQNGEWSKHSATITAQGNRMMLQFGGIITERNQFIALDDISMTAGTCAKPANAGQFACVPNPKSKSDYVPLSKVCDFVVDCASKADEQNCGYQCTFDSGDTCSGWTVSNLTSTFVRVNLANQTASPFNRIVPTRSHKSESLNSGSYLRLFDQPGPFVDNPEANFESAWIQNSGPICSFSFYYYLSDPLDKQALLRVRLIEQNNPLGVEVFRDEGKGDDTYWKQANVVIGRIRGQFKIQINGQMKIARGGGVIAIDDIEFHHSECGIPVKASPQSFLCSRLPYQCADKQHCVGEDRLCDFNDDCGDNSDESAKLCDSKTRGPIRCDFEDGTCFWRIDSRLNKTHANGMHWGPIDAIDDYAYGVKRDHTLNSEFGHVIYSWNDRKAISRIRSPLIQTNASATCMLRLYYAYHSKDVFHSIATVSERIGKLNVYITPTMNGKLFKLTSVNQIGSTHFDRLDVSLNGLSAPFFVVLEVVPGKDPFGIWAIDDVSFSSGCRAADNTAVTDPSFTPFPVTTKAPNVCTNGTSFLCDQDVCLWANQVCDFVRDCNDNTDEANCGETSFTTGWADDSKGRIYWSIDSKSGEVRSKVRDGVDSVARLWSASFSSSGVTCAVRFDYFVDANSESLKLSLLYSNKRHKQVWAQLFNSHKSIELKYGKWNTANVFIGEHQENWRLMFSGEKDVVNNRTETMRLRNVRFVGCAWTTFNYTNCDQKGYFTCDTGNCVPKSAICDYNDDCGDMSDERNCGKQTSFRCSFESTKNTTAMCGLAVADHKWTRFSGLDTRNFMGPGVDHTTDTARGHFVMVTGAVFNQVTIDSQTQMETAQFDPDQSGDCHVRFWYMMSGAATLTVNKNVKGATVLTPVSSIDATADDTFVWKLFSEPLTAKLPYTVVFSAKIKEVNTKTFIAIDDISFTAACKHSKPKPPHSNATTSATPTTNCLFGDQFECNDGSCISFDEVCDFYPTCPNGDDELDCPANCDFENSTTSTSSDLCMWGVNNDDPNPQSISISRENVDTAAALAQYYPPSDNTLKNSDGHFMFIYVPGFAFQVEPKLDLNIYSGEYTSAAPVCTLSLDYYLAVDEEVNATSVYVISLDEVDDDGPRRYPLHRINALDLDMNNQWNTITVGIGRRPNTFQLVITRLHDPNMPETLSIDNIILTKCAYTAPHDHNHTFCSKANQFTCRSHFNCIPLAQVCDMQVDCPDASDEANCTAAVAGLEVNFEAKDGFNSTGWTLGGTAAPDSEDNWRIVSGAAPHRAGLGIGPPFDHTYFEKNGHYLYARPFDFGVDVDFVSPMLKATTGGQQCVLRFYYYFYVNSNNSNNYITVYVRNQTQLNVITVNRIRTQSQDIWKSATVSLQSPGSGFQVIISGISGGDYAAIALDDIQLTAGCVVDTSGTTLPPGTVVPPTGTTATPTTGQPTTPTPTAPPTPAQCQSDPGYFWCAADNICLPPITRCNFIADCSDGMDEAAPDCTQQTCPPKTDQLNTECGMNIYMSEGSNYTWSFSDSGNFTKQTGVRFDHMSSTFLYMDLNTGGVDDYSNLVSQPISETGVDCMLKFTYACTATNCPLQVSIISKRNTGSVKSLIWLPLNSEFVTQKNGYLVKEARIYLGRRNSFQVSIGSVKLHTVSSFVLLSSITFDRCLTAKYNPKPDTNVCTENSFKCAKSYGNCISSAAVCDYQKDCRQGEDESDKLCSSYVGRCDFENLAVCDFWQYQQLDDRWAFALESGQHGLSYLPSIDHTGHSASQYYLTFHSSQIANYLSPKQRTTGAQYSSWLVSDILTANVTADCRFRFWYNLIGPGNCQLRVLKRYNSGSDVPQMDPIRSDMFDYWTRQEVTLAESSGPRDFQVVLQAVISLTGQQCSVNIDDVSFTPACTSVFTPFVPPDVANNPNNTLGNLCRPNLMCADKSCYSLEQRCNFVLDCNDGTDEASCPATCDFETNMCGWYTPKGTQATFNRTKGLSPNRHTGGTGPKTDHTKGTADGTYIVARNFAALNSKVQLHSPYFSHAGPNCRLSFAYFLNDASHSDKITLYLKTTTHPSKMTKIWSYDPKLTYATVWNTAEANIGQQKAFSLVFEAVQGKKDSRADLAFDDFQFLNCHQQSNETELICAENEYRCEDLTQCLPYWRLCDGEIDCSDRSDEQHCTQTNGTCWFENKNWKTFCNWVDLKKDFNFEFASVAENATADKDTNTGPQSLLNDQFGYALAKAKGHKLGERAAIASPVFPASVGVCALGFHHYMFGSDSMGELTVYTLGSDGKRVDYFHLAGNQGPQWNYVEDVIVGNAKDYRVVFEAVVGADRYSDIAVGYVSFSKDCAAGRWVEKASANLTVEHSCPDFYCHQSHECISKDWVCDGEQDCKDGSDEANCASKNPSKKNNHNNSNLGRIATISGAIVVVLLVVPALIYLVYTRVLRPKTGDREPILDNSAFETTSHRDLDYTRISARAKANAASAARVGGSGVPGQRSTSSRSQPVVSFEMTTRRTNGKK